MSDLSPSSMTLPLRQWLRLLPPVVASLALVMLEGVVNDRTIALASQCQEEQEWEFDFIRALAGWNPEHEHNPRDIAFLMDELYDDMVRMNTLESIPQ